MRRKYLEDIGLPKEEIPQNYCPRDKRRFKWWKERRAYGFDERETWALYHTFAIWLYERLMKFKEVSFESTGTFMYQGEVFTEREAIDFILAHLEKYLRDEPDQFDCKNHLRPASEMWAVIVQKMWW